MAAAAPAVVLLGAVQGDQDRQGPAAAREGEADQEGHHDPLVPPAEGGVGVRRADGVAVPRLAVDVLAPVFVHGVVAGQEDRAVGQQVFDDPAGQELGQPPAGPAPLGEEAAVAGGVAGGERPQGAQEVGDGVTADGEQGGAQQQGEAQGGGRGEGAAEGAEQVAGQAGQSGLRVPQLSADGQRLASLPSSPLSPLGLGQPLSSPAAYAGHCSLLVRNTGSVLSP